MNRVRSPKYPNFSLRQAVKQAEKIFKADRRNTINRADAVAHMGYSGLSGPADKTLATLVQFGLLDRVGKGEVRVSETAVQILHPDSPKQRGEALTKAGYSPEVFKAIRSRFPEGVSPESLRSFLVREDYMDRAIDPIMKAFTDTAAYLKQEGAIDSGGGTATTSAELEPPEDDEEDAVIYGGAQVGDLIQWESGGALQLEKPTRVRWVSDDSQWIAVDGSDAGIPMSEALVHERAAVAPPAIPPAALTKAQGMAGTPGLGPVSAAQIANLPLSGWTQAVFPLADGPVFLHFPDQMSADGYAELKEYLEIFLRRAERQKRQQEGKPSGLPDIL